MTEQRLAQDLHEWFERHRTDRNRWRTPVGRLLRAQLKLTGNWKNAKRGKPTPQNLAIAQG